MARSIGMPSAKATAKPALKQSPAAAKFLTRKGYKVAGVLRGGMERWQAERLPVEQRTPGPGLDLPETADRD